MSTITVEDAPVVTFDIFPAIATLPDGRVLSGVRVLLTEARAYLYVEHPSGPRLHWTGDYVTTTSEFGPGGQMTTVLTPGGSLVVRPGHGCGCGSMLRGALPEFTPYRRGPTR